MEGSGVIDRFLEVFTSYIDSGFGLLGGEVAFIASTLIVIDITLAARGHGSRRIAGNVGRDGRVCIGGLLAQLRQAHLAGRQRQRRRQSDGQCPGSARKGPATRYLVAHCPPLSCVLQARLARVPAIVRLPRPCIPRGQRSCRRPAVVCLPSGALVRALTSLYRSVLVKESHPRQVPSGRSQLPAHCGVMQRLSESPRPV